MEELDISTLLPRKSHHYSKVTLTALASSFDALWHQFVPLG